MAHLALFALVVVELALPVYILLHLGSEVLHYWGESYAETQRRPDLLRDPREAVFVRWLVLTFAGALFAKLVLAWRLLVGIHNEAKLAFAEEAVTRLPILAGSSADHVTALVVDVAEKMTLERDRIQLKKDGGSWSVGATASVLEGKVVLVLPVGALLLAGRDEMAFKAMVAHELAHVVNGDPELWGYAEGARRSLVTFRSDLWEAFLFVGAWASTLAWKWAGDFAWEPRRFLIAGVLAGLITIPSLVSATIVRHIILGCRRRSEVLADLGAAQVAGLDALRRAIDAASGGSPRLPPTDAGPHDPLRRNYEFVGELHRSCDERKRTLALNSSTEIARL